MSFLCRCTSPNGPKLKKRVPWNVPEKVQYDMLLYAYFVYSEHQVVPLKYSPPSKLTQ